MPKNNMRIVIGLAATALLAFGAAGCAAEEPEPIGAADSNAVTEISGGSDEAVTSEATDTTPALTPSECLVGTWLADNELFLAQLREFGTEAISNVTGQVILTYEADGTLRTDYQAWEMSATVEGQGMTIHRHGIDTGVYTATDTELTWHDESIGSQITTGAAGISMEIQPEPAAYDRVPYTCDDDEVTLSTHDGDAHLYRQ